MRSVAADHNRCQAFRKRRAMAAACSAAAAAIVLLTAGCSSGSSSSASSAGPGGGSAPGIKVTATETEWHIALSRTSFSPGKYTFVAVDKGKVSHNLNVVGPGVNANIGVLLSPAQSASVTVTLRTGTYDIFCSFPGHKAKGMDVHITVS
jgi:uncharacterized cupredoxin-like copper-binding protein